MKRRNTGSLVNDFARLPSLSRTELAELWETVYKASPPCNISRTLMLRALAYRLQEQSSGGLKPITRRQLQKFAQSTNIQVQQIAQVRPGTRLLREWHGVTHEVLVMKNGVQYRAKTYRSLSQVAQIITGTKWSGPLFFGLRRRLND